VYQGPPEEQKQEHRADPVSIQAPLYRAPDGRADLSFFIQEVVDLNSKMVTWKAKLEFTSNLIHKYKQSEAFPSFRMDGLAILAAYHYFINTGKVKCGDQGHFRPNHSAGFSYGIYKTLDQECLILPQEDSDVTNSHVIRLFKQQLPSFADQFMTAVPMTRIRDIAHRNDMPKELKLDIKHRL
jgi:phosphoglucan,water dikinase